MSYSLEGKKQFIPLTVFYPGQFFGLWELLDSNYSLFNKSQWNLYSGTRSLFSTAKITNLKKYKSIQRKYGLKSKLPVCIKEHHFLFKELANHPSVSCDWTTTILFFSGSTRNQIMNKNTLMPLQTYFLKLAWQQSMPWRFDAMMRAVWENISFLLKENHFKESGFQLDILKYIVRVSLGALPCFISDDPEERTAPLSLIKEMLIDDYGIDFCPTLMMPGHISKRGYHAGYYSINESIVIEKMDANRSKKTTIEIMRGIQEVYEFMKSGILNDDISVDNPMFKQLIKTIELSFFHSSLDHRGLLLHSSALSEQDKGLVQLPQKHGKSVLPFNESGSFFRGLIKINAHGFFL